jgi:hypothetical protein
MTTGRINQVNTARHNPIANLTKLRIPKGWPRIKVVLKENYQRNWYVP